MKYLLLHSYFSTSTILTLSFIIAVAGLIYSRGIPDLYTCLLLLVMTGVFLCMKDYFPPTLIYALAIVALFMASKAILCQNVSLYLSGLELAILMGFVIFCTMYFDPSVLTHLAIIGILLISFVFLV